MVLKGAKLYGSLLACSLAFGPLGCGKAKEALEDELGFSQLDKDEISAIENAAGGLGDNIEVVMGFSLTDNFDGDLGARKEFPLPLPDNATEAGDASGKNQNLILLRKLTFNTGGKTEFTRFQIVNVAEVNEDKKLIIDGAAFNKYIAEEKQISKDNGNQEGDYLLVKTKDPNNSFAFVGGNVQLKPQSGDKTPVGGALVFTDSSPFVTESGKDGKYLLAMFDGAQGYVTGYARDGFNLNEGTPKTTTAEITYAGVIPPEKIAEAKQKSGDFNNEAGDKVEDWATAANDKLTPLLGGWSVQPVNLLFVEPKKDPPKPKAQEADTPTADKEADPAPPENAEVIRKPKDDTDNDDVNIDLGCTGVRQDGKTLTLTTDGAQFASFKGWRGLGDVRITSQSHADIFGDPATGALAAEKRYLDQTFGYCVVSTGNGQFNASDNATQLQPQDGKTSEMWQSIKVPENAAAIQIRYAFFTQEAPDWVGSGFNDSFFVKFDESPDFLASGNLNDLAGSAVSGCKADWKTKGCGEWKPILESATSGPTSGVLWDIDQSTQATNSTNYSCGGGVCFHGWVPPRVICKNLTEQEKNKTMTLRMNVTDAGDSYYDSAFAVDSIVFSTKGCSDDDLFTGDERSPVGDQQ